MSDQFCWLEKDLANIVSTCEIVWSLFKKIRSISDISDTWLEEWNTFFYYLLHSEQKSLSSNHFYNNTESNANKIITVIIIAFD